MREDTGPRIPTELQPQPGDFDYDLHDALAAIVSLRARIPDDAFTASILGTERGGHGVMIADTDLIVTIGYLKQKGLVTQATFTTANPFDNNDDNDSDDYPQKAP